MILLRHGESAFNVVFNATRRDPGIADPDLTETGRRQIESVAGLLARREVRRIITSPYTRALESARILADSLDLAMEVDHRVRERRSFACDIGTPRRDLARRWPDISFDGLPERWWPEAEESEATLAERCEDFRRAMAALDDWRHVVVVTHWGVIRALTGLRLPNGETVAYDPERGAALPER